MPSRRAVPLLLSCLVSSACGDGTGPGATGQVEVGASAGGPGTDQDGFLVTLDGAQPLLLSPGSKTTFHDVAAGRHQVQLAGLAGECAVSGSNPRPVRVERDRTAQVVFAIRCGPPTTGGFHITIATSGSSPDPDGYELSVAGTPLRPVEINDDEVYQGLAPTLREVTLKDLADACEVKGGNPQPFAVVAGKILAIRLSVVCGSVLPP